MIGASESLVDSSHVVTHVGILPVLTICCINVSPLLILVTVAHVARLLRVKLTVAHGKKVAVRGFVIAYSVISQVNSISSHG